VLTITRLLLAACSALVVAVALVVVEVAPEAAHQTGAVEVVPEAVEEDLQVPVVVAVVAT
jgi:hypothetical protein